jgi:hypothetical protein
MQSEGDRALLPTLGLPCCGCSQLPGRTQQESTPHYHWKTRLCAQCCALWLQAVPRLQLPQDRVKALTERIQDAGTEVVKAKVSNNFRGLD